MKKAEFIQLLRDKISDLPPEEIEKTLHFYEETIDDRMEDGFSEEEAVEALGRVEDIASELKLNLPFTTLVSNKIKGSRENSSNRTLRTVLLILGFPLWGPLLVACVVTILAVYLAIWSVLLGLGLAFLGMAVGVVLGGINTVLELGKGNYLQGSFSLGIAITMAGLFLMGIPLMAMAGKAIKKQTTRFVKWIKTLLVKKEVQ